MPAHLSIILGSESDRPILDESKALLILDEVGVGWNLSYISAHRHRDVLSVHCEQMLGLGVRVFIGAASMSAALPGDIASIVYKVGALVIGVPLPWTLDSNAEGALRSIVNMPTGMPVAVCGKGKPGLVNAAFFASQIIAQTDLLVRKGLVEYRQKNPNSFQISIQIGKHWTIK